METEATLAVAIGWVAATKGSILFLVGVRMGVIQTV